MRADLQFPAQTRSWFCERRPAKVGVRETRHVDGGYTITGDDITSARPFEDTIALGGYPIDIHAPDGDSVPTTHIRPNAIYQIPLRSLLVKQPVNLIVVGRCISATHEAAAAFRCPPIAMAIGQGGGVAAAAAVRLGVNPVQVPFASIRDILLRQGARLP